MNVLRHRSIMCFLAVSLISVAPLVAAVKDCNDNGVSDDLDLLPSFGLGVEMLATPGEPIGIAAADFDLNGKTDLAVGMGIPVAGEVKVLWSRGARIFEPSSVYSGEAALEAILTADFNGDLLPDLAFTADGVGVLLNKGSSTFALPTFLKTRGGPRSLTVGDFDGDATPDLATANKSTSDVSIFLNEEKGVFRDAADYPVVYEPTSIDQADLDGDGDLDLAVATGWIYLLRNQSDGRFQPGGHIDMEGTATHVAAADLDRDGGVDLIVTYGNASGIRILRNQGQFEFSKSELMDLVLAGLRSTLAADFDDDGDPDVLALRTNTFNSAVLLSNNGEGGLDHNLFVSGMDPSGSAVVTDLDGDGSQDTAIADLRYPGVALVWGNSSGRSDTTSQSLDLGSSIAKMGDFDGDREQDIALAKLDLGGVSVLMNRDLTFGEEKGYATGEYPSSLELGDLDGDARLDVTTANSGGGNASVLRNAGDGTFAGATNYDLVGDNPVSHALADFNGDGMIDLAAAIAQGSQIEILLNDGEGNLRSEHHFAIEDGVRSVLAGDLDGGGNADLVTLHHQSDSVFLRFNDGEGSFEREASLSVTAPPNRAILGDLDDNGSLDIVVAVRDYVALLLGEGAGSFTKKDVFPAEPANFVSLADLDGDGRQDLILRLEFGSVLLLFGEGGGTFGRQWPFVLADNPRAVLTADLDRDDDQDLILTDPHALHLVMNLTGPAVSRDMNADLIPDECQGRSFHRGDPNADGTIDISDGLCTLKFLFSNGGRPACMDSADANNDGAVDCSDASFILGFLFLGTAPPAAPGPIWSPCGPDPEVIGDPGNLGCDAYAACRA